MSFQQQHQPRQLQFSAADGYVLSGTFYPAADAGAIIIIASATGVPQRFYRRFAEYAASAGFAVVTFDYRGIGHSAPASLKGFQMDYRDWARLDLQAVVQRMSQHGLPLCLLGHSYGGHALGLLDNHQLLSAAYFFGLGAGWHGWMPAAERLKVLFMWHLVAPVLTRAQGYLGWSVLGMGEDLPLGVYQQWKRWCSFRHYFFDDNTYPELKQQFAAVNTPIKAVSASDDKWAPPRSRDAFIQHYSGSAFICQDVSPAESGCRQLGHMGYFRADAQSLWPDVLAYFRQHIQSAS